MSAEEAKLEYVKDGEVLNMWHTEVPPALQGKGIAKILAQVRKSSFKSK
jgi:predicted GNAT family acetyltransferase